VAQVREPVRGEYWRAGDRARIRCTVNGKTTEVAATDSRVRSFGKDQHGRLFGSIRSSGKPLFPMSDVWQLGLIEHILHLDERQTELLPLHYVLERGQKAGRVRRQVDAGHDCIVIELIDPNGQREIWLDPKYNYLVRRTVYDQPAVKGGLAAVRTERVVTRFAEPVTGIFFPEEVQFTSAVNGKQDQSSTTVFSDIRINEPLPADVFDLPFPAGTEVDDSILGKRYKVDATGNPIGETIVPRRVAAPPVQGSPGAVSTEEPRPWSWWVLPASIGILGWAAAMWLRRKLPSRTGNQDASN